MVRRVRWFGFNFSKIEYRETAEEYQNVMDQFIPDYSKMPPHERVATLTSYLKSGIPTEVKQRVEEVLNKGADKSLAQERKDNEALEKKGEKPDFSAIAYQTLKRMELARDHNDIITDNVLAECGALDEKKYPPIEMPTNFKSEADRKSQMAAYEDKVAERAEITRDQGVANMLEAQLLQRFVDKNKKKALLGVIPLFEDYNTMQNADKIMEGAYTNTAYMSHLQAIADRLYEIQIEAAQETYEGRPIPNDPYRPPITQQVQIAHSDNRRRAGSLAGTAFIHDAHDKIRRVNDQYGIKTQFFEGGSMSDPFRNGVRAVSAQVNAFGLYDFAKFTFQGRDMLQYFNHPGSNIRFFSRQFAHAAASLSPGPTQAGEYMEFHVPRRYSHNPGAPVPDDKLDRLPNAIVEEIGIAALKRTLGDYHEMDFTKKAMGTLYAALGVGYEREAKASNRGSRAAARGVAFAGNGTSSNHMGAAIALDKLRTIPFSMVPQQNQLTLSWVGGGKLKEYLKEEITERLAFYSDPRVLRELAQIETEFKLISPLDPPESREEALHLRSVNNLLRQVADIRAFVEEFKDVPTEGVQPKHIQYAYEKSPAFRDAIDKAAFAIARTDMDAVAKSVEPKFKKRNKDKEPMCIMRLNGHKYVEHLQKTLTSIGDVVYGALTGGSLNGVGNTPTHFDRYTDRVDKQNDKEQSFMMDAMDGINGLGQEIAIKNNYQDFTVYAKTHLGKENRLGENDNILALLLAGGLTSTHSRWINADDPAMAEVASIAAHARREKYEQSLSV